jgi:hypothetical protein
VEPPAGRLRRFHPPAGFKQLPDTAAKRVKTVYRRGA